MNLTSQQKKYVNLINSFELTNINHFLDNHIKTIILEDSPGLGIYKMHKEMLEQFRNINKEAPFVKLENPTIAYTEITSFISVLENLLKDSLIFKVKKDNFKNTHKYNFVYIDKNIGMNNVQEESNFYDLVNSQIINDFYPTPALGEFIKNRYKTNIEIKEDREKRMSYVSIISAIIAVVLSGITSCVNIKQYSTFRNVEIKNAKDFPREISVIIKNPERLKAK